MCKPTWWASAPHTALSPAGPVPQASPLVSASPFAAARQDGLLELTDGPALWSRSACGFLRVADADPVGEGRGEPAGHTDRSGIPYLIPLLSFVFFSNAV